MSNEAPKAKAKVILSGEGLSVTVGAGPEQYALPLYP